MRESRDLYPSLPASKSKIRNDARSRFPFGGRRKISRLLFQDFLPPYEYTYVYVYIFFVFFSVCTGAKGGWWCLYFHTCSDALGVKIGWRTCITIIIVLIVIAGGRAALRTESKSCFSLLQLLCVVVVVVVVVVAAAFFWIATFEVSRFSREEEELAQVSGKTNSILLTKRRERTVCSKFSSSVAHVVGGELVLERERSWHKLA